MSGVGASAQRWGCSPLPGLVTKVARLGAGFFFCVSCAAILLLNEQSKAQHNIARVSSHLSRRASRTQARLKVQAELAVGQRGAQLRLHALAGEHALVGFGGEVACRVAPG